MWMWDHPPVYMFDCVLLRIRTMFITVFPLSTHWSPNHPVKSVSPFPSGETPSLSVNSRLITLLRSVDPSLDHLYTRPLMICFHDFPLSEKTNKILVCRPGAHSLLLTRSTRRLHCLRRSSTPWNIRCHSSSKIELPFPCGMKWVHFYES